MNVSLNSSSNVDEGGPRFLTVLPLILLCFDVFLRALVVGCRKNRSGISGKIPILAVTPPIGVWLIIADFVNNSVTVLGVIILGIVLLCFPVAMLFSNVRQYMQNIVMTKDLDGFIHRLDKTRPNLIFRVLFGRMESNSEGDSYWRVIRRCEEKEEFYIGNLKWKSEVKWKKKRSLIRVDSTKKVITTNLEIAQKFEERKREMAEKYWDSAMAHNEEIEIRIQLEVPGFQEKALLCDPSLTPWWLGYWQFVVASLVGLHIPYVLLFRLMTDHVAVVPEIKINEIAYGAEFCPPTPFERDDRFEGATIIPVSTVSGQVDQRI